jgi:hypothetical protein
MRRFSFVVLYVVALLGLAGCAGNDFYYSAEYPEFKFDPSAW